MIGSQLSHFKINLKLGEGGMGEVYRATDSRLGRDVAIKILPAAFTADPERLARFEREARVLASLTHPNVAAIHDVGQAEGVHFLVMELAQGETLAERLRHGPPGREHLLSIASQIAEALEAAHAKGIVHRDLKPANVVITEDDRVKLLDFGLAKALEGEAPGSDPSLSHSPTMTAQATAAGVILGTAAYMSPEQARGKAVDARADIWTFGLLLYEMLTGDSPFKGETVSDTLAAVLRADIDWKALPAGTPASLRNLLRRCLERDPQRRLHSISDARIVVQELVAAGPEAWAVDDRVASRRAVVPWLAVGFVAGAVAGAAILGLVRGRAAPPGEATRSITFRALTHLPGAEETPTLAPDGASFAYVKEVGGQKDVFLQRVDGRNAINLTSGCAEHDTEPAFSRDGKRIAYRSECSGGGIFVMGATGESVRKVTDFGFSPAWSPDGNELAVVTEQPYFPWGRTTTSELWAVQVETGERRRVSQHDSMHPSWSPDGRRIAFWGLRAESTERDLWTVAADGSQAAPEAAVPLTDDRPLDWNPVWSGDGRSILFSSTRGGTFNLWRMGVDTVSGRPTGEPRPMTAPSGWAGWLSVSGDDRHMVFVDRNARNAILRVPIDRAGNVIGTAEPVPVGSFELSGQIALSPDGQSLLFATAGLPQHLVVLQSDGTVRLLTDGPHRDRQGAWSPDGEWIAFQTDRFDHNLALIRADGSGLRPLAPVGRAVWFPVWSPDGSRIAFTGHQGARWITFDPDGVGQVEALPQPPQGMSFAPWSFSDDGMRVAGELSSEARIEGLAVLSLDRGTYRELPAGPGSSEPTFLADNRYLVWLDGDRLVHYDLVSGRSRSLIVAPSGRRVTSVCVAGDGRSLLYLEVSDESDIWLATLE